MALCIHWRGFSGGFKGLSEYGRCTWTVWHSWPLCLKGKGSNLVRSKAGSCPQSLPLGRCHHPSSGAMEPLHSMETTLTFSVSFLEPPFLHWKSTSGHSWKKKCQVAVNTYTDMPYPTDTGTSNTSGDSLAFLSLHLTFLWYLSKLGSLADSVCTFMSAQSSKVQKRGEMHLCCTAA